MNSTYDLQSGKVDKVAYQHGYPDAFYHSYIYDAENRLTNVLTSSDSINWDNDAYYAYYLHGPLARTILGDQQVQGINYGYTLQGWTKAINPPIYNGSGYNLSQDGTSASPVAANAYSLLLNYYQGDDSLISGATGTDAAVSSTLGGDYRPLYNGNISSLGVNIGALGHPLLYNYRYDQLNRLVQMDAWNNTGSTWSAITKLQDFQERVSYDANGNILKYKRNGNNTFVGQPLGMDSLNYFYTAGTNKLDHITDSVPSGNYSNDLDNQLTGNYGYDAIGELTKDSTNGISNVSWTVYGKIQQITKSDGSTLVFTYDPGGNRISKTYTPAGGSAITTWYVRDAQGNILSIYTSGDVTVNGGDLSLTESDIYGSSRLGMLRTAIDVYNPTPVTPVILPLLGQGYGVIFARGDKLFELTNHLGNVLATISDKKYGVSLDGSTVDHYVPQVVSASDYYPFGSQMPGRDTTLGGKYYRYGFGGQEKDDEIKGSGNAYTAEFWEYDPRIGRRWNLDPKPITGLSEYSAFNNNPISIDDPLGDTVKIFGNAEVTNTTLSDKGGTADQGQNAITFKDAQLVPAVDPNNNNKLIGYNVFDTKNTGRDMPILQIEPGDIEDFKTNYNSYMGGARLYYSNGEPSEGMKKLAAALDLSGGKVNWNLAWEGAKEENKKAWTDPVFVASFLVMTANAGVGLVENPASNPISEASYKPGSSAAKKTMNGSDVYHRWPDVIKNGASGATKFTIVGKDKVVRILYQIEGSLNGKDGRFEWILEQGQITHQQFVPGGSINGIPIKP